MRKEDRVPTISNRKAAAKGDTAFRIIMTSEHVRTYFKTSLQINPTLFPPNPYKIQQTLYRLKFPKKSYT